MWQKIKSSLRLVGTFGGGGKRTEQNYCLFQDHVSEPKQNGGTVN